MKSARTVPDGARWLTLFDSTPTPVRLDLAAIPIRIVLAWIFIYYGSGKLFGAFNGPGVHRTALFFAETAHLRPGTFFAVIGGIVEFGGGIAVGLGLGTRLAGLALAGDQVIAMITVTWGDGIGSLTGTGGYEFNIALTALALALVALGPGRISVDELIVRRFGGAGAGGDRMRPSAPVGRATAPTAVTAPAGPARDGG